MTEKASSCAVLEMSLPRKWSNFRSDTASGHIHILRVLGNLVKILRSIQIYMSFLSLHKQMTTEKQAELMVDRKSLKIAQRITK